MKKYNKKVFGIALGLLAAFVLWTVAVGCVDVQPIGPQGSAVGFATLNRFVHSLTGVHMSLYTVTDWLGLVPLCVVLGFALLGLAQWIGRKQLRSVDHSMFVLGGFYVVVMAAYALFEQVVINYRPVLIEGRLEASYPSSTTLLVLCVMPTAMLQFYDRISNRVLKGVVLSAMGAFVAFMVLGRLVSGVHWVSDIIGGALLSGALVLLYHGVAKLQAK